MSNWFRGVIEGAYVGSPARESSSDSPHVAPYDIRIYRASIGSIERVEPPEEAEPAHGREDAQPRELRQEELADVSFTGVGSEEARDHHAAFDLRITDVRLLQSAESNGKIYGRLLGTVVASLTPTRAPPQTPADAPREREARSARIGSAVEALRWVMIALVTWVAFGSCGAPVGALWLAVVLPAALLRLVLHESVTKTHGVRVFGWGLVLASACGGGLMVYRATHLECSSTLWWLGGLVLTVLTSSLLPSRYPFLWTQAIFAFSTLSLCFVGNVCETKEPPPSVISQGPRTDPDGRWPRDPQSTSESHPLREDREHSEPLSISQALSLRSPALLRGRVAMLLASQLFDASGLVEERQASQLLALLDRSAPSPIVVEVHGRESEARASQLRKWLTNAGRASEGLEVRSVGASLPIVPSEGLGEVASVNDRVEVRVLP